MDGPLNIPGFGFAANAHNVRPIARKLQCSLKRQAYNSAAAISKDFSRFPLGAFSSVSLLPPPPTDPTGSRVRVYQAMETVTH